ncbi:MAG: ATP-binding cassette domain-containing protein [Coriobacteriia bacterium]|jgi:energy-coupling factor transport system ATP-binding protein|nr:ATP-binding cassette domain-containing protein [Coriobacteriia bacterium]
MIQFSDVSYEYHTAEGPVAALVNVSTTVAPGELVCLLGPNGSGKSTLARLADGLIHPTQGSVLVDAMDTRDHHYEWDVRSRVGLVFQNPDNQIVATTVAEDVAFGPENLGIERAAMRERVTRSLEIVGLSGLEDREPHTLSGGQKQRLAIAGALALQPAYLVLDEPTAMLDLQGRADVLRVISALADSGTGIVHITHHLADAAAADRVVVLASGGLVYDGPPEPLLADDDMLGQLGLALPPIGVLAAALRDAGVPVPADAFSAESVVAAL